MTNWWSQFTCRRAVSFFFFLGPRWDTYQGVVGASFLFFFYIYIIPIPPGAVQFGFLYSFLGFFLYLFVFFFISSFRVYIYFFVRQVCPYALFNSLFNDTTISTLLFLFLITSIFYCPRSVFVRVIFSGLECWVHFELRSQVCPPQIYI